MVRALSITRPYNLRAVALFFLWQLLRDDSDRAGKTRDKILLTTTNQKKSQNISSRQRQKTG